MNGDPSEEGSFQHLKLSSTHGTPHCILDFVRERQNENRPGYLIWLLFWALGSWVSPGFWSLYIWHVISAFCSLVFTICPLYSTVIYWRAGQFFFFCICWIQDGDSYKHLQVCWLKAERTQSDHSFQNFKSMIKSERQQRIAFQPAHPVFKIRVYSAAFLNTLNSAERQYHDADAISLLTAKRPSNQIIFCSLDMRDSEQINNAFNSWKPSMMIIWKSLEIRRFKNWNSNIPQKVLSLAHFNCLLISLPCKQFPQPYAAFSNMCNSMLLAAVIPGSYCLQIRKNFTTLKWWALIFLTFFRSFPCRQFSEINQVLKRTSWNFVHQGETNLHYKFVSPWWNNREAQLHEKSTVMEVAS